MSNQQQPVSATRAILTAWLIAGTLDICGAMLWSYMAGVLNKVPDPNPLNVLNSVGSVAMGKELFTPAMLANFTLMCIVGLVVHYLIAFAWTLIFFWSWPKFKLLQNDRVIVGLCYGIFVWAVMTFGVVPLRRMVWPVFVAKNLLIGAGIIMVAIGLPISIIIGNFFATQPSKTKRNGNG